MFTLWIRFDGVDCRELPCSLASPPPPRPLSLSLFLGRSAHLFRAPLFGLHKKSANCCVLIEPPFLLLFFFLCNWLVEHFLCQTIDGGAPVICPSPSASISFPPPHGTHIKPQTALNCRVINIQYICIYTQCSDAAMPATCVNNCQPIVV